MLSEMNAVNAVETFANRSAHSVPDDNALRRSFDGKTCFSMLRMTYALVLRVTTCPGLSLYAVAA